MFLVGSTIQNTPLHQKKDKYFFPVMTHNITFHFYCDNKSSKKYKKVYWYSKKVMDILHGTYDSFTKKEIAP